MNKRLIALSVAVVALIATASAPAFPKFHFAQTQDGNIGCAYGAKIGVRCDIANHTWASPPKPARCDVDYGGGVQVGKSGPGSFVCAGDTTLHQGKKIALGVTVKAGRYRCTSFGASVRCVNKRTHHGFVLGVDTVTLF